MTNKLQKAYIRLYIILYAEFDMILILYYLYFLLK